MKEVLKRLWGFGAVAESFALEEFRRQKGWVANTVPKAQEFNQWQREKDEQVQDIQQELEKFLLYGEQVPQDQKGQVLKAFKKALIRGLKEDPLSAYKLENVGAMRVYNGELGPWQDGVTIPGWLACIKKNSKTAYTVGNKTFFVPDLSERFLSGAQDKAEHGLRGGLNQLTLTSEQMPQHSHTSANHTHNIAVSSRAVSPSMSLRTFAAWNGAGASYNSLAISTHSGDMSPFRKYTNRTDNISGIINGGGHHHAPSASSSSSSVTINSKGQSQAFDNRPAYHKVLYILKTAEL